MPITIPLVLAVFLPLVAAHSNLIKPKPRNAIDSELPEWKDGNAPYMWVDDVGNDGTPCACKNGTDVCAPAQTCLWFNVGCTIGCKECDGGTKGPANPNRIDRCGAGMKATLNDPAHRTINRDAVAGSDDDWTKFNPWRAPGHAPVWDPCGRASGSYQATPGKGEVTNTTFAELSSISSLIPQNMPSIARCFAVKPLNLGAMFIKYASMALLCDILRSPCLSSGTPLGDT